MTADYSELQAVWRNKWKQAKMNLELARIQFNEIEREGMLQTTPDEDYQRAFQALAASMTEYSRVLRIYTDLALHDKIPEP